MKRDVAGEDIVLYWPWRGKLTHINEIEGFGYSLAWCWKVMRERMDHGLRGWHSVECGFNKFRDSLEDEIAC